MSSVDNKHFLQARGWSKLPAWIRQLVEREVSQWLAAGMASSTLESLWTVRQLGDAGWPHGFFVAHTDSLVAEQILRSYFEALDVAVTRARILESALTDHPALNEALTYIVATALDGSTLDNDLHLALRTLLIEEEARNRLTDLAHQTFRQTNWQYPTFVSQVQLLFPEHQLALSQVAAVLGAGLADLRLVEDYFVARQELDRLGFFAHT